MSVYAKEQKSLNIRDTNEEPDIIYTRITEFNKSTINIFLTLAILSTIGTCAREGKCQTIVLCC